MITFSENLINVGIYSPWRVAVMSECHVSGTKVIEASEDAQATRDSVAALDPDHRSDFAGVKCILWLQTCSTCCLDLAKYLNAHAL